MRFKQIKDLSFFICLIKAQNMIDKINLWSLAILNRILPDYSLHLLFFQRLGCRGF